MVAAGGRVRQQGQGQESMAVYDGGSGDGEEAEVGAGCGVLSGGWWVVGTFFADFCRILPLWTKQHPWNFPAPTVFASFVTSAWLSLGLVLEIVVGREISLPPSLPPCLPTSGLGWVAEAREQGRPTRTLGKATLDTTLQTERMLFFDNPPYRCRAKNTPVSPSRAGGLQQCLGMGTPTMFPLRPRFHVFLSRALPLSQAAVFLAS